MASKAKNKAKNSKQTNIENNNEVSRGRNFHINVQNFDGDPSFINFFFSQLEDLIKFNNYNDAQALCLLKSKLSGNALKFFLDNDELQNVSNLNEAKHIICDFFLPSTTKISATEFNNIKLLPSESIKNLAHRLNSLACKVYPGMPAESLNQIKLVQFIAALPADIQFKIYENNTKTYQAAIEIAQNVQDAQVASCLSNTASSNYLQTDILNLPEQMNAIQSKIDTCQLCNC